MTALARDLLFDLDASSFARVGLGITPDPWQERLITSTAPRIIVNCSRQSGKSTGTAIVAARTASYQPGQCVLALAPTERQASLLFAKAADFIGRLGMAAPQADSRTQTRLHLRNGSSIFALPGKPANVRGFAADLVIVDEAAFVEDPLLAAVGPAVAARGGRIILLSTPNGRRGFFYDTWRNGEGWERFSVSCWECPRLATQPDFLDHERRTHGPFVFSQEYECQFIDSGETVFASEIVERAVTSDLAPLWANS